MARGRKQGTKFPNGYKKKAEVETNIGTLSSPQPENTPEVAEIKPAEVL